MEFENSEIIPEDFEEEGEDDEILGENDEIEDNNLVISAPKVTASQPTRKRKRAKVPICTVNCRYEVVRRCAKQLNMKDVGEDDDWLLYWTDCSVSLDRVMSMKRYQRINHFPGMSEICRKDMLARNMNRLHKAFPKDYNIFPKSWVLPADYGDFQNFIRSKKNKCYITKPEMGCQGKGIYITKNPQKDINAQEHQVVQQYISRPLLMDGMKFDLRVYVLVSGVDPLRIFVFNEGLVRLATVNYTDPTTSNTDEVCMHLTNYAINKHNENFVRPTGAQDPEDSSDASKRSFAFLRNWLDEQKLPKEEIFKDMHDLIIKTIVTAHPILKHNYRTCFPQPWKGSACFEILGFDILLDRKLKPWLIEVNHSPSFHTDSKLDKEIKTGLIRDTLTLLDLRLADRRKCLEEDKKRIQARLTQPKSENREQKMERVKNQTDEWLKQVEKYEQKHIGGFERIYPPEDQTVAEKYAKFFNSSASLFQTTATQRAREEAARIQLEEIRMKNMIEQAKRQGKPIPDLTSGKRGESAKSSSNNQSPQMNRLKNSGSKSRLYSGKKKKEFRVDIMVANPINDVDENERKFQLRQRNAQIKSLGIPDLVQKLINVIKSRDRTVDRAIDSMGRITTEHGAIGVVDKVSKKMKKKMIF